MRSQTVQLKSRVALSNDLFEKLDILKDTFAGETAYIVTCGPSLSNYDSVQLNSFLSDKLVLSIKQAYQLLPDVTDFHILHHSHIQRYRYGSLAPIVVNEDEGHSFVQADLLLPKEPSDLYSSISLTRKFAEYRLADNPVRPCGPGILYEIGLYLALHLGVTSVVIVGWDLYSNREQLDGLLNGAISQSHFYENDSRRYDELAARDHATTDISERLRLFKDGDVVNRVGTIPIDDIVLTASGSRLFAEWLASQGMHVFTTTDSPNVSRWIPRIDLFETEDADYLAGKWRQKEYASGDGEFLHFRPLKSSSIDITAADHRLSVGWHAPEIWNGVPVRWSGPTTSSLIPLPLARDRDLEIVVRIPASVASGLPVLLESGEPIPLSWAVTAGAAYEGKGVLSPDSSWNEVFTVLEYRTEKVFCPGASFPGSKDWRLLGLPFASCSVHPVP